MGSRRTYSASTPIRSLLLSLLLTGALTFLFATFADGTMSVRARPAQPARPEQARAGHPLIQTLLPLHETLPPAEAGSWRSGPGRDERWQSHAAWRHAHPVRARGTRRVLYVQHIGAFDGAHAEIVTATLECMGIYFGLPVRVLPTEDIDDEWPLFARRPGRGHGEQLRTTYILDSLLAPSLPQDGAVLVGLTRWDLFPQPSWNYVFGQASLHKRVGVWSIGRFGDPDASRAAWRRCLRRACKLATHETGHMFTMHHCTRYRCNMNGSNSLEETDHAPLHLCPECLAKVVDATGVDPLTRYETLRDFCERMELRPEASFYARSAERLRRAGN